MPVERTVIDDRERLFQGLRDLKDPYAYSAALRVEAPVFQPPERDWFVVTGFDEALKVLCDEDTFSFVTALQSTGAALPFEPIGADISEQVEKQRNDLARPGLWSISTRVRIV
jgi:cytochrome P450